MTNKIIVTNRFNMTRRDATDDTTTRRDGPAVVAVVVSPRAVCSIRESFRESIRESLLFVRLLLLVLVVLIVVVLYY